MNRFTVGWRGEALDELADIWLESNNRNAIAAASQEVDAQLSQSPLEKGAQLPEGLRRLDVPPLRVYFSVILDDCKVEIIGVRKVP